MTRGRPSSNIILRWMRAVSRVREAAVAVLAILCKKAAIDHAWTPDLRCHHNCVFQQLCNHVDEYILSNYVV